MYRPCQKSHPSLFNYLGDASEFWKTEKCMFNQFVREIKNFGDVAEGAILKFRMEMWVCDLSLKRSIQDSDFEKK